MQRVTIYLLYMTENNLNMKSRQSGCASTKTLTSSIPLVTYDTRTFYAKIDCPMDFSTVFSNRK